MGRRMGLRVRRKPQKAQAAQPASVCFPQPGQNDFCVNRVGRSWGKFESTYSSYNLAIIETP